MHSRDCLAPQLSILQPEALADLGLPISHSSPAHLCPLRHGLATLGTVCGTGSEGMSQAALPQEGLSTLGPCLTHSSWGGEGTGPCSFGGWGPKLGLGVYWLLLWQPNGQVKVPSADIVRRNGSVWQPWEQAKHLQTLFLSLSLPQLLCLAGPERFA